MTKTILFAAALVAVALPASAQVEKAVVGGRTIEYTVAPPPRNNGLSPAARLGAERQDLLDGIAKSKPANPFVPPTTIDPAAPSK